MKLFARINAQNNVVECITATQEQIDSGIHGDPATLIETASGNYKQIQSAGGSILRKYKATGGMIYDRDRDAFYWKKPEGEGWTLNETTLLWEKV